MERAEYRGLQPSQHPGTYEAKDEVTLTVVSGDVVATAIEHEPSPRLPILLSCLAFWLCCMPLGIAGFVQASGYLSYIFLFRNFIIGFSFS